MIRKKRAQAIIINAGKLLMVRHHDHHINQQYWCLPGGGVEAGETAEQAVIRELKEETGLTIRIIEHLGTQTFPDVHHGYSAAVTFRAEAVSGNLALGYDPEYADKPKKFLQEVRWVELDGNMIVQLNRFLLL